MGPLVVVLRPERIEGALLARAGPPRRTRHLPLERPMHPFVCPVLLRPARMNALVLDPEAHPPPVEVREAVDRLRRERHAVIGPGGAGQPILPKRALEDGARRDGLRRAQPMAREQEPRMLIRDREGIAVDTIARSKLALECQRNWGKIPGRLLLERAPRALLMIAPPLNLGVSQHDLTSSLLLELSVSDRVTPTLPSRDFAATSAFYAALGFHEVFRNAGWLIVARDALQLEFFPYPELDPLVNYAGCCLRVADARSLHAAFQGAGLSSSPNAVPRLTPPVDQSWGFREFALVDLDGNLLRGLEPLPAA